MNGNEIKVSRKFVNAAIIALVILAALWLFGGKFRAFDFGQSQNTAGAGTVNSTNLVAGSAEKFAYLSGKGEKRSVGST